MSSIPDANPPCLEPIAAPSHCGLTRGQCRTFAYFCWFWQTFAAREGEPAFESFLASGRLQPSTQDCAALTLPAPHLSRNPFLAAAGQLALKTRDLPSFHIATCCAWP